MHYRHQRVTASSRYSKVSTLNLMQACRTLRPGLHPFPTRSLRIIRVYTAAWAEKETHHDGRDSKRGSPTKLYPERPAAFDHIITNPVSLV